MPRCVILDPSSGQSSMPMTTPQRKSLRPRRSTSKAMSGFGGYDSDSSFDPDEEQRIYARGGGAPRKQTSLMGAVVPPPPTMSSSVQLQPQQHPGLGSNPDAKEYVAEPRDTDIFSNRGRNAFRHPGNQRFREIILEFIEPYQNAKSRHEKTSTVDEAYERILDYGGRFLKKDRSNGDQWYVISAKEARTKVGHTLRDCCTDRIKSIKAARDGTAKDCGITKWASPPSSNRRKSRNRRNSDATNKRKKAPPADTKKSIATASQKKRTPAPPLKPAVTDSSPTSVTNISSAFDTFMEEPVSFHPPEIDEIESASIPKIRMNFPRTDDSLHQDLVSVVTNSAASSFSTDYYNDDDEDDFGDPHFILDKEVLGKGADDEVEATLQAACSAVQEECASSAHLIPVEPETTLDSSVIDMYNAIPLGDLDDYLSPEVVQNAYGYQQHQRINVASVRAGGGGNSRGKPQTRV